MLKIIDDDHYHDDHLRRTRSLGHLRQSALQRLVRCDVPRLEPSPEHIFDLELGRLLRVVQRRSQLQKLHLVGLGLLRTDVHHLRGSDGQYGDAMPVRATEPRDLL